MEQFEIGWIPEGWTKADNVAFDYPVGDTPGLVFKWNGREDATAAAAAGPKYTFTANQADDVRTWFSWWTGAHPHAAPFARGYVPYGWLRGESLLFLLRGGEVGIATHRNPADIRYRLRGDGKWLTAWLKWWDGYGA